MKRLIPFVVLVSLVACGNDSNPSAPSVRIPSYAGSWSGTYTVTSCSQSGSISLANICGGVTGALPYGFALSQSDRSVSGTFSLGQIAFPAVSGTVAQDGSLALGAVSTSSTVSIVANWNLNLPASALTGTVAQVWTSSGLTGAATLQGAISTATRSEHAPATLVPHSLSEAIHGVQQ